MPLQLQANQGQSLKQMQRLIMSPQMQQAIAILQMPLLELADRMEIEIEKNPLLESCEDDGSDEYDATEEDEREMSPEIELSFEERDFELLKKLDDDLDYVYMPNSQKFTGRTEEEEKELRNFIENSIQTEISLFEHLMTQASQTFDTAGELAMAESLIGNFDSSGFFHGSLGELAVLHDFAQDQLAVVLQKIQQFDPPGVGAQNLRESLLLQLKRRDKEETIAYRLLDEVYDDLLHNHIPNIQKKLHFTAQDIQNAIDKDIRVLDLHPGANFSKNPIQPIIPDVSIALEGETLVVSSNDDLLPSFRLNRRYLRMLEDDSLPQETREFIKEKLLSARWFYRNLQQRGSTIEGIALFLTKWQREFFLEPHGKLKPLKMQTVAEALHLNASTVARAIVNKYANTPRGLFPLRYFFTNSYATEKGEELSSLSVREELRKIIASEDKKSPLSDASISLLFKAIGISCARRTIAKYRALCDIGNAHQRKQY